MGHATGLVGGMLFGLTRPYVPTLSTTLTGVAAGSAMMVATNTGNVVGGTVDPPQAWSLHDWMSDVVPHVVYGLVLVEVYERWTGHRDRRAARFV
jgi:hypothetical protein